MLRAVGSIDAPSFKSKFCVKGTTRSIVAVCPVANAAPWLVLINTVPPCVLSVNVKVNSPLLKSLNALPDDLVNSVGVDVVVNCSKHLMSVTSKNGTVKL